MHLIRLFHTVRHLKRKQLVYRIKYEVLRRWSATSGMHFEELALPVIPRMQSTISSPQRYIHPGRFELLNIRVEYPAGKINWNDGRQGKLWLYHLCAMEYLMHEEMGRDAGLELIRDIMRFEGLRDGLEPWPMSLRLMNTIRFLVRHGVNDGEINGWLKEQARRLSYRLEWHLMANHLLENLFALVITGLFLGDKSAVKRFGPLLEKQLAEQILEDGGHFERSPMYHAVMLQRVLDVYHIQQGVPGTIQAVQQERLANLAGSMLAWLQEMTMPDGRWAHFNDSTEGIAPSTGQLATYAKALGIAAEEGILNASGYRRYRRNGYELVVDVGDIGPDYQPGHAHCDTFSFVLYAGAHPFIVDTGISTYERGEKRNSERSTAAHNTVRVAGVEQSDIWAAFRVGSRAKIIRVEDRDTGVVAAHDGYRRLGVTHERSIECPPGKVVIKDRLSGKKPVGAPEAFFHFSPEVELIQVTEKEVSTSLGSLMFVGASGIEMLEYEMGAGFNRREKALGVKVIFEDRLTTHIVMKDGSGGGLK